MLFEHVTLKSREEINFDGEPLIGSKSVFYDTGAESTIFLGGLCHFYNFIGSKMSIIKLTLTGATQIHIRIMHFQSDILFASSESLKF